MVAIKAENISKQYRLGTVSTGTIAHDMNRWWHKVRGKEDPYLKIGATNDRTINDGSEYVWALKDINFEIKQGESVGIIGRNGAGKSTLLKILSQVTSPTTGNLKIRGRIASLLEVGTGFHPELTGRENIFLNGAILGMTKSEIKGKFDEIVEFAGVAKYIDTPVKRYSSGMMVRLGFAVAAHLEPEILIVDEVLAVGDLEFQKKCLGKMNDVNQKEGRTVLFVSHNMNAIKNLCKKSILMQNGGVKAIGDSDEMIQQYFQFNQTNFEGVAEFYRPNNPDKDHQLHSIALKTINGAICQEFDIMEDIFVEIIYSIKQEKGGIGLGLDVIKQDNTILRTFDTDLHNNLLVARDLGKYRTVVKLPSILKAGTYTINTYISLLRVENLDDITGKITFNVVENSVDTLYRSYAENRPGLIKAEIPWETLKIEEVN